MIGKYFSNGWKICGDFPMIGKIFGKPQRAQRAKESGGVGETREEGGREATRTERKPLRGQERALSANLLRQLEQLGTTFPRCAAQPGGAR